MPVIQPTIQVKGDDFPNVETHVAIGGSSMSALVLTCAHASTSTTVSRVYALNSYRYDVGSYNYIGGSVGDSTINNSGEITQFFGPSGAGSGTFYKHEVTADEALTVETKSTITGTFKGIMLAGYISNVGGDYNNYVMAEWTPSTGEIKLLGEGPWIFLGLSNQFYIRPVAMKRV